MKPPFKRTSARSSPAIQFARDQRSTANEFAHTVWQWLRNRQICRQKFRREYPVPPYTADFRCVELKLIVEVDGAGHVEEEGQQRDQIRDEALCQQGFRVLRISGYDLLREAVRTCKWIEEQVKTRLHELQSLECEVDRASAPHPRPLSPRRGEGS